MILADTSHAVSSTSAGSAASLASSSPAISPAAISRTVAVVIALSALDLVVERGGELARLGHVRVALHLQVEAGSAGSGETYFCTPGVVHSVRASSRKCVAKKVKHWMSRDGGRRTWVLMKFSAIACERPTPSIGEVPRPS
jgi:hypothetical protein